MIGLKVKALLNYKDVRRGDVYEVAEVNDVLGGIRVKVGCRTIFLFDHEYTLDLRETEDLK